MKPSRTTRVAFELTDTDLREVYDRYYRSAYKVDRRKLPWRSRVLLWIGVAVFAPALLVLLFTRIDGGEIPLVVVLLNLVIVCALLGALVDDREKRRREAGVALDRTMQSCVLDSLLGRWTVELTTSGVQADYAAESRLIKWAGVWGFHLDDGFVSIVGLDSRSIVIPLRAFDEPRETSAETFVRTGEEMLAASGHGFRARLAEYLAAHDVPCPRCKYNLRGGAADGGRLPGGPHCPECGWVLTPAQVPEAFGRRRA